MSEKVGNNQRKSETLENYSPRPLKCPKKVWLLGRKISRNEVWLETFA